MSEDNKKYYIIDKHTDKVVGQANSLKAARRSVDQRDNAYGGHRYQHRRADWHDEMTKDKQKLDEAFLALIEGNVSQFNDAVKSALKLKLAEKFDVLEPDVVNRRFQELDEVADQEKRFVALHGKQVHPHPVAPEDTFTSNKSRVGTPLDAELSYNDEDMIDPNSTGELLKRTDVRGKVGS